MKLHLKKEALIQSFPSLYHFINECYRLEEMDKLENLIMALEVKNVKNSRNCYGR